jgi:hypothetical protein
MSRITINIPDDTHQLFRTQMEREGEPIQTFVIVKLVKAYAKGWIKFQGTFPEVDSVRVEKAKTELQFDLMEAAGELPEPSQPTPKGERKWQHEYTKEELEHFRDHDPDHMPPIDWDHVEKDIKAGR